MSVEVQCKILIDFIIKKSIVYNHSFSLQCSSQSCEIVLKGLCVC